MIEVVGLRKVFRVPVREAGFRASVRSVVRREHRDVVAVDSVDVTVAPGEIVGFLGPNGAGKTTTLKMLAGLLQPSAGHVRVLGFEPQRREHAYLRQMAMVMGNRNQLQWDLPAADSFDLTRVVYRIGKTEFGQRRDELVELLDLGGLIDKPVRNLSLGERMKAEFANSLLHRPQVLFLDEPTLGLDVTMQRRIRSFLGEYNRRHGAAIMLTSHYMADVEALCERVVVIHHGAVLFDGHLRELADRFAGHTTIVVTLAEPADLSAYGDVITAEATRVELRVDRGSAAAVTARLLAEQPVSDLSVAAPPIDEVIELAFASGTANPHDAGADD